MKIYELKIKDEDGDAPVYAMSVVDKPAIEIDFIKLSEETNNTPIGVKLADDDEQIILGPALVPEKLIYRSNINGEGEGYVKFSEETVRQTAYLFLKNNKNNEVTIQHNEEAKSIYLMESWVIEDIDKDKAGVYGYTDLPTGTWMMSYKVDDDDLWNDIKDGNINGFSIEGNYVAQNISMAEEINPYDELLNDLEELLS